MTLFLCAVCVFVHVYVRCTYACESQRSVSCVPPYFAFSDGVSVTVWLASSVGIYTCGGLNRFSSHRVMRLNAWPQGTVSLGGVAFLEEVCHCVGGL